MATITVKNIPEDLYGRLKAEAAKNHRSINGEVIACIERSLMLQRVPANRIMARARRLQASIGGGLFTLEELDRARREGRE